MANADRFLRAGDGDALRDAISIIVGAAEVVAAVGAD
jgi:hypothetical protein